MKRLRKAHCTTSAFIILTALTLLATGCAPPPAANELQQRIEQLMQIQQQQAGQLEELQQQLARLQNLPTATPNIETLIAADNTAPEEQSALTAPQAVNVAPSAAEIAELSEAASLYLEAFAAIATGQMVEAETGFRSFITRYPDHEYVGNANYSMAEALLAQQKPKRAETILLGIIDSPKQQNKAPAAMARLAQYYRESGARNNATAMLQMLSTHFPESPELKRLMRSTEPR